MAKLKAIGGYLGKRFVIVLIVLGVIIAIGLVYWHQNSENQKNQANNAVTDANQAAKDSIKILEKSQKPVDRASLVSAYITDKDYDKAVSELKSIASKSGNPSDYMALLRVCSVYKVSNKQACINNAQKELAKNINSLTFRQAYTVGSSLETAGLKKEAASYFQRALAAYGDTVPDEYTYTKDQLKDHIDDLQK